MRSKSAGTPGPKAKAVVEPQPKPKVVEPMPKPNNKPKDDKPVAVQEPPPFAFEYGWSEEHFCMWRKEILGPTSRGPIQLSAPPIYDDTLEDLDVPALCVFSDGHQEPVPHLTQVASRVQTSHHGMKENSETDVSYTNLGS